MLETVEKNYFVINAEHTPFYIVLLLNKTKTWYTLFHFYIRPFSDEMSTHIQRKVFRYFEIVSYFSQETGFDIS